MVRQIIPLAQVPSQKILVTLNGQNCTLILRSLAGKQYLSLSVDSNPVFYNTLIVDRIPLKKYDYLPFVGDLACVDTQGTSDPDYKQWNTRFQLVYDSYGFKQQ